MDEISSQRVNFLHRRYTPFTYRSMTKMFAVLCGVFIFIYLTVFANVIYVKKKVDAFQLALKLLNERKEQQLKVIESLSQRTQSEQAEWNLADILTGAPKWSKVIKGLTRALPRQVRLTEIKTSRNADKGYILSIKGRASSRVELADFVSKLGSSGGFARTELSVSAHTAGGKGGLSYEIHTQPNLKMFE